jgi:hypothetical protein
MEAGEYEKAIERFRRADALVHAPTIVVSHGRALMALGRFVEAQERFELVLREGVGDSGPRVWKSAMEDAASLLEYVRPRVAWVTISVVDVAEPKVEIDGQPIPAAALGVRRAANPGTRTVEVSAEGFESKRIQLELVEGEEESLRVELVPLPAAKKHVKPKGKSPVTPPRPLKVLKHNASSNTPGYVALAVGGLGIAAGSVTGWMALMRRKDLKAVCADGMCPPSAQEDLDRYHTYGTISGVAFGVGIAGLAASTYLLLTGSDARADTGVGCSGFELRAGLGSLGIQGAF